MVEYHDREWGVPVREDRRQFEFLVLESAQAGLSWYTILRKRAAYRAAFADFDPERVALYTATRIAELARNPGIVRHRGKIEAAVHNARCLLAVRRRYGSFSAWLWDFVDGEPIVNRWREPREVPVTTALSDRIAKALKQEGFRFLGSTTVYAHLQATGLVNDHLVGCFRHAALAR